MKKTSIYIIFATLAFNFLVVIFALVFIVVGLFRSTIYKGEYPNLYTEANHSLLWANGHSYGADIAMNSEIYIIEEDSYGRVLFSYREKYFGSYEEYIIFSALLIAQKTTEEEVFYYEDVNFIVMQQDHYDSDLDREFSKEDIVSLKEANDWEKEPEQSRYISKKIINQKEKLSFHDELNEKLKENKDYKTGGYISSYYLDEKDGKTLFYGIYQLESGVKYFYGMRNEKNEFVLIYPEDYYNYHAAFTAFKTKQGWYD